MSMSHNNPDRKSVFIKEPTDPKTIGALKLLAFEEQPSA